jgi:GT2 family glycosyltransferase
MNIVRPNISFVVPVHKIGKKLELCIQSIKHASHQGDQIILVFDGNPSSEEKKIAIDHGVKTLYLPENCGPAAARNASLIAINTDIIFFVDSDVMIAHDAPARAIMHLKNDHVAAVFGAYSATTPAQGIFTKLKNLQHSFVHLANKGYVETFWSGCSAIRRDAFITSGGFDEDLRFCEDIALGYKLGKNGNKIILDPGICGTHLKEYTLWSWLKSDLWGRAVPWARLILTKRAAIGQLNTSKRGMVELSLCILSIISLLLAIVTPPFFYICILLLGLLAIINYKFLIYTLQNANSLIMLMVIPYVILHYLVACIGLVIGVAYETFPWLNDMKAQLDSNE